MNPMFKQLTTGVHFNTKVYRTEAEKFGLVKRPEVAVESHLELPTLNKVKDEFLARKRKNDEEMKQDPDEIDIFGNIKSMKKRKKEKLKPDETVIKKEYWEKICEFRNENKISVKGSDTPSPFSEWKQLVDNYSVSEKLFNNITYPRPTPIQMQAIPLMLQGREVLACAPTGSGKTAAFVIPIIHQLKAPKNGAYRAVILVPTNELSKQIERECLKFCTGTGIRPHAIGKVKEKDTLKTLNPKQDILITAPKRLVHMLTHDPPVINLEKVEWLIIDEADKLFEVQQGGIDSFREQLAIIYKACNGPNIRRGMFSATMEGDVQNWCKLNLDNLVSIRVGVKMSATETISQKLIFCGNEHGKLVHFRGLVQSGLKPPTLVFVQSKDRGQQLFKELLYDGIHVDIIHSERSQLQRENTVRAFRSGGIWVLICTELMGRGIDFKGVNLVINYDFPPSAVSYIHRIGRTGRAGREGHAITYYTEEDKPMLKCIANVMQNSGCEVPEFILALESDKKAKLNLKNREPINKKFAYENKKKLEARKALAEASKKPADEENEGVEPKKKKKPAKKEIEGVETKKKKKSTKDKTEGVEPKKKKNISKPIKDKITSKEKKMRKE